MNKFFDDCNRIIEGLYNRTYKFKDLVKIAEDYEDCGSGQDEITISNIDNPTSMSLILKLKSFRLSATNAINFDNKSDLLKLVYDIIQPLFLYSMLL